MDEAQCKNPGSGDLFRSDGLVNHRSGWEPRSFWEIRKTQN
jgi:hypothetical protein